MKKNKANKLKAELQDYSNEMHLISILSKVLVESIMYNDNIKSVEKEGLVIFLDRELNAMKKKITDLRVKYFGYL